MISFRHKQDMHPEFENRGYGKKKTRAKPIRVAYARGGRLTHFNPSSVTSSSSLMLRNWENTLLEDILSLSTKYLNGVVGMKGMKTLINLLTSIRWAYLYLFASYLKHFLLETYPCDAPVRRWRCTRTKWQCLLYRRTKLRRSTCQGILGPTGKHKLPRQDGRWEAPVGVTGAGSTSNSTQGEGLGLERTLIYALCLNKKISLSLNIILCYLL